MSVTLFVMAGLVLILGILTLGFHGWSGVNSGLSQSFKMLQGVAPQIILGFMAAGLIQVVVPPQVIARLIGEGSGIPGVLVATVAGALTPAGPFVSFPLVVALYKSGAGVGPLVAYIISWGILPIHRMLIWELPLLGPSFALPRYTVSLLLPIVAGILAPYVFAFFGRMLPNLR